MAPGLSLHFDVRIEGVSIATFTGCSGFDAQFEAVEWQEGGDNGTVVRLPGRLSYSNVLLSRSVDADSGKLAAWFTRQQRSPARQTVHVRLYNATRGDSGVIASWTLEGAWPVRYSGPKLSTGADGEAVAVETLELSHQGFVMGGGG